MRSSTVRARPSIQGRHRSTMARALARRRKPGQPLAHDQGERLRQRRLGAVGQFVDAAPLVALLEARGEIGGHALHAVGADGLDARLLDRLEHGAGLAARRREPACSFGIVAGDGERRGVGMAADHGDLVPGRHARGSGSRAVLPDRPAGSLEKMTSTVAVAGD